MIIVKAGYWVVWFKPWESYEVVCVNSDEISFDIIGYDLPIDIESKDYEFIKPFDPEDIVLNRHV